MEPTRRAYGVAALGGGLALLAVLLRRPLLLIGVAGLGAWLLGTQWAFIRAVTHTTDHLAVDLTLPRNHVTVDDSITVVATVSGEVPSSVLLTVEVATPVAVAGPAAADRTLERTATTANDDISFTLTATTVGRHQFPQPRVTLEDTAGLFQTTIEIGDTPELTVEPRQADDVHVGEGGEQLGAFGSFRVEQYGEGLDPAHVREYVPGDPADRIDWNATARLDEPHVLDFEVDTDRRTMLVVDHRPSVGEGETGARKLDYLRQVALAFLRVAHQQNQAIGLLAVGDAGITTRIQPSTGEQHYTRLRDALLTLETVDSDTPDSHAKDDPQNRRPAEASHIASTLQADDSRFGQALYPFFADAEPYVQRLEDQPLYHTVRTEITSMQGTTVTMLLTDDTHPSELREALDAGTLRENRVAAFLTPSALFEPDTLTDLSQAYERYTDFEAFRADLASRPQVEAYEVAPESRVEAVLTTRHRGETR